MQGLSRDTFGRQFIIPNTAALLRRDMCISLSCSFHSDSCTARAMILIDHDGDLPMHACMGLPLLFGDKLLGVLTRQPKRTSSLTFQHVTLKY
ncbi:hypothetical protein OK016_23655 [Vibrio chagasii]|nr:hypothetical protein [Vibrio chagasii]